MEDYQDMVRRRGQRNLLYLEGDGRTVRVMDMVKGSEDIIPLSEYE